jgi:hypothetical protein
LFDAARDRAVEPLEEALEHTLRRAPDTVGVSDGRPDLVSALTGLARLGRETRGAELDRFAVARDRPGEDLVASLTAGDLPHAAGVCVELARAEPAARPEPADPNSVSWQIPGPGGHVRHYVALRCVGALPAAANVVRAAGVADPAELKRAWLYGFLVAEAIRLRDDAG